jgi:hypothetical protein
MQLGLIAVALAAAGGISAIAATAPVAPNRILIRSLSPQDIKDYSLTGLQGASGLSTIGVGQPAYLDAAVPVTTPASNFVSVTWALTDKPLGSTATLAESPLGANVPLGSPAWRRDFWLAARRMLRPDVEGTYTVVATFTMKNGATNITQKITGARYLGMNSGCMACHGGGPLAPDMTSVTNTPHTTAFQRKIDDSTGHFGANCVSCHVLGYDLNTNAVNGGFDDIAKANNWTLPATLTNGNWAAMPAALKNVANVQCESCHGPGSKHVISDGILGNPATTSVSMDSANCGQCHDAKTHHIKSPEWNNSTHAIVTASATGPGRESCAKCHTGRGFAASQKGKPITAVEAAYEPIGCAACHDPHDMKNPHQLRAGGDITLENKAVVKNAGNGAICMNCHLSRRDAEAYVASSTGGSTFGPHHSNQADMLAGENAIEYGKLIGSSAHGKAVEHSCVGCHAQTVAANEPGFTAVGGHTFKLSLQTSTNKIELVKACTECHGNIESFDMKRTDYDGDGVVEGVQSEVKNLLRKLARLLPPVGVDKETISITSTWTKQQLRAGYNWKFVGEEGSFGIHNPAYAVGILKASIADLTGDSNNDGLPDAWQIQYFGSANNPNAAPNATPAGDYMPNWLKYSLGLVPTVMATPTQVPGGVVWANAAAIGGSTNTIQIFTAAEVAFNTEAGKTYQLEAISTLGGGWSNVGEPIVGDGKAYSFVTPTRGNVQQYFRVTTR